MKRSKRVSGFLLVTMLALAVAVPAVLAAGGTRIVLKPATAYPAAKGSAQFKARAGERELEAEVEHIRRLAGKRVVFFVGGAKVGAARVSGLGAARISRNTERGQRVSNVGAGTKVKVRTVGGALIVFGSF
jgi:hypothetical protein